MMGNPRKLRGKVSGISKYGQGTYKVDIECSRAFPKFKPGQFLHLAIDCYDEYEGFWPESRIFSIASISDDRDLVSIVYSVKGSFTKRMEEHLTLGKELWIKAPYGNFIIDNHVNKDDRIVIIAGGTGISPFIPYFLSKKKAIDVTINYGIRSIDDILFIDVLGTLIQKDGFILNLFVENNGPIPVELKLSNLINAKLSISDIMRISGHNDKTKFFISGPPDMVISFKNELSSSVEEKLIIIDEWG